MVKAVFDTNVLVSAFLSRNNPGGVSNELLCFARHGAVQLHVSPELVAEVLSTLVEDERSQRRYNYTPSMAAQFCDDLLAAATVVVDPPAIPGAVPRDPDDDKIIACAVSASVAHIVSRDDHLLSLGSYAGIPISTPEQFIHLVRQRFGRLPDRVNPPKSS